MKRQEVRKRGMTRKKPLKKIKVLMMVPILIKKKIKKEIKKEGRKLQMMELHKPLPIKNNEN